MHKAWRHIAVWSKGLEATEANHAWERAVVVDGRDLHRLKKTTGRLRACAYSLSFLAGSCLVLVFALSWQSQRLTTLARELRENHRSLVRTNTALAVMARSHQSILAATEQAPSVGTKSWGRRFVVTMYVPRSPKYGKFNDGLTATLTKADPANRIVAVDPALIPYGSWLWVEGLGWFRAEDCGSAIKGFRLDLLTATEEGAMAFGKQERFTIVVPPTNA